MPNSRSKGNAYERHVAKLFSKWWGTEFRRTPLSGGWDKRHAAGDLFTLPEAKFPFVLEAKNRGGWHLEQMLKSPDKCVVFQWWDKEYAEYGDRLWMVFTKDHDADYLMMSGKTFTTVTVASMVEDVNLRLNSIWINRSENVFFITLLEPFLAAMKSDHIKAYYDNNSLKA